MDNPDVWRGDRGLTDIIDQQDLPKSDLRFEVLGTIDEASSAIGLVRAGPARPRTKETLLEIQRDLCWMMSELAEASASAQASTHITPDRLVYLAAEYKRHTEEVQLGKTFVIPGDTTVSATLHLARSIVRRAERNVTRFVHQIEPLNPNLIAYLNRLSALLFAMARAEDAASGTPSTEAHPSSNGSHPDPAG